jgi:hypothetical protein
MTYPIPTDVPIHPYKTVLCRERLDRLLDLLERRGGQETLRQLDRLYSITR